MAKRTCSVVERGVKCTRPHRARGLCKKHYDLATREGRLHAFPSGGGIIAPEDRFWSKVNKDGPIPEFAPHLGPCWIWTASLDTNKYAQFVWRGKMVSAHRFSHVLFLGAIPPGYEVDHLCRVRHCVNPRHLEAVTPTENKRRSGAWEFWRIKTHCPQGHAYDEANTYVDPKGHRHCRICRYAAIKRVRAKKRGSTIPPP